MQFCVLNSSEQLCVELVSQDTSPYSLIPVVLLFYTLRVLGGADCWIIQHINWLSLIVGQDGFNYT